jgi:hypothetical protein
VLHRHMPVRFADVRRVQVQDPDGEMPCERLQEWGWYPASKSFTRPLFFW